MELIHGFGLLQAQVVQPILANHIAHVVEPGLCIDAVEAGHCTLGGGHILIEVGIGGDDVIVVGGIFLQVIQQIDEYAVLNALIRAAAVLVDNAVHDIGIVAGCADQVELLRLGVGMEMDKAQVYAGAPHDLLIGGIIRQRGDVVHSRRGNAHPDLKGLTAVGQGQNGIGYLCCHGLLSRCLGLCCGILLCGGLLCRCGGSSCTTDIFGINGLISIFILQVLMYIWWERHFA